MLRYFPTGRTGQTKIGMAVALIASLLVAAFLNTAPSSADGDHSDLHHRKHRLDNAVDDQQADLDEISTMLVRAQARVDTAVSDVADARTVLADLRVEVHAAVLVDQEMQERLDQAIVRLEDARADLDTGHQDMDDRRSELAGLAISNYQTGGIGALTLGLGLDAATTQEVVDGLQGIDAEGNKQAVVLQELQAAQVILRLTAKRVENTRDDVHVKRVAAAESLKTTQRLEGEAEIATRDVLTRVANLRTQREQVAAAKQRERERLDNLQRERNRVETRLRKIAERRARQHHSSFKAPPANGGGFLSYPVNNTYITSPYGMRLHPILHIWELHDGTDFHADCGSPVYAAAAGTVTETYYNAGYGNRLFVDHGYVQGVSLATSYNHLTSFVAGVGEHVERGELIAYSGTTGYSTACHLHFMVYVNGGTVDPVTWL